ncbi:hypothetical protein AB0395_44165 [Streptosporangium sp. NPDC051023]|uniref:hypothetical protein n=1 Tax=Streptosporangium sp. NPDC051023 TaxID=3155410 RepID=UPI00344B18F5
MFTVVETRAIYRATRRDGQFVRDYMNVRQELRTVRRDIFFGTALRECPRQGGLFPIQRECEYPRP